tara:strand:- start:2248 stop:2955 length:708 start_codon:yes stop_codon:yes gene_type:complete
LDLINQINTPVMNSKFLIYQYFEEKSHHLNSKITFKYQDLSKKSISKYAHKFSIDYKFYDNGAPFLTYYGIFLPFLNGNYKNYDAICFIDSDVLATIDAIDIFENIDINNINTLHMNTGPLVVEKINSENPWNELGHANSGVVVFPKLIYEKIVKFLGDLSEHFKKNDHNYLGGYDQLVVNNFEKKYGFSNLNYKFNYHLGRYNVNERKNTYFIHYHRNFKKLMNQDIEKEWVLT